MFPTWLTCCSFSRSSSRAAQDSVAQIQRLLSGNTGLLNTNGNDIFSRAYPFLVESGLSPAELFTDILKNVFNAATVAALHVDHLKGSDGEIALRLRREQRTLWRHQCRRRPQAPRPVRPASRTVESCRPCRSPTRFSPASMTTDSKINLLIGSKKFTEGWSSWRVSTMGLMNVGQTEGSQIIQLFGRGVRLKGYNFGLKRSGFVDEVRGASSRITSICWKR